MKVVPIFLRRDLGPRPNNTETRPYSSLGLKLHATDCRSQFSPKIACEKLSQQRMFAKSFPNWAKCLILRVIAQERFGIAQVRAA